VPWASVFVYTGLLVILVVVPYFTMHGNAVAIFSDEAGIGTVPILVVYLLANISLPLYMLGTNRAAFRPVKHVLIPLIGSAVLVYGVYEFVQPSQPPPANVFWAWILAIVLVAAVATAIVYLRRPGALQRAVASGPEYIVPDAPGRVPDAPGAAPEAPGR
jgi:amino acid transporter